MLLELKNIHKSFGEVEVLKGIDLRVDAGVVMGLVGENGAGKSTLMNILGGVFPPTKGEIIVEGEVYQPHSPRDAQEAGFAFIHQELNLFPNLSVSENLLLQHLPKKKILGIPFVDLKKTDERAKALIKQVGLDLHPTKQLGKLPVAKQQLVEIAKALSNDPRLIIFDEPTTALSRHEVEQLFSLIAKLKAEGKSMIYISHNLKDVMHLADEIVVLRDGELVGNFNSTNGYQTSNIIKNMVGRDVTQLFPDRDAYVPKGGLLKVEQLQAGSRIRGLSFEIGQQEVVGFYGLVGAGRSEMARMIYGLDYFEAGYIYWKDEKISQPSPEKWIQHGVGFLTEDRREEGLMLSQNIEQNIGLASLPKFVKPFLSQLNYPVISAKAGEQAKLTQIKYQSLHAQAVSTLSGGNQQKVVLAKWLLTQPSLLILDEPTKGIDIGAKYEIYTLINQLVDAGAGIMFISSEIEELLGICDRILVMSEGQITANFKKKDFNRTALLEAALHNEKNRT